MRKIIKKGAKLQRKKRIVWLHAFSPQVVGFSDEEVVKKIPHFGLKPVFEKLNRETQYQIELHYFTKSRTFKIYPYSPYLTYFFHPVSFTNLPRSKYFGAEISFHFYRYLSKNPPFLLHHNTPIGLQNYLLGLWLKHKGIPYVLHCRSQEKAGNIYGENLREDIASSLRKLFFKDASAVITLMYAQAKIVSQKFQIPLSPIWVIHSGVDEVFKPEHSKSCDNKYYPTLLFVGNVLPFKGSYEVVKCLNYIKKYFSKARLYIVGRVRENKYVQEYVMKIKDYIKLNNLDDSVIWTGFISHQKLARIYNRADLFVFPSRSEGCGVALMEAMTCGVPCVVLRGSGGPEDIIDDGINGAITNLENLNEVVLNSLENPNILKKMGENAREKALAEFSSEVVYLKLKELYDKLSGLKRDKNGDH